MKCVLLALGMLSAPTWAQSMDRSELPEAAHTVGAGKLNLHMDGYQSRYGITDKLDIGTRVIPSYLGLNLQLRYALLQDADQTLSLEPLFWMEWPWAELGYPSSTMGAMVRYSRSVGKGQLNLGLGLKKDKLKVTLRESVGDEFETGKGLEVTPEFSLTLLRAPSVFHESVTQTDDGWNFEGYRAPVVIGYEHPVSERSTLDMTVRVHTLHIINGGSWAVELHPSWFKSVGESFRFGLGLDVLAPGMPFPIADKALAQEIADEEDSQGYQDVMSRIPLSGAPVFVLPTLALWWRI
jgi:hypothetical protein